MLLRQSYPDQYGGRFVSGGDVLSFPDQHGGRVASEGDVFPLLSGAPLAQYDWLQQTLFLGVGALRRLRTLRIGSGGTHADTVADSYHKLFDHCWEVTFGDVSMSLDGWWEEVLTSLRSLLIHIIITNSRVISRRKWAKGARLITHTVKSHQVVNIIFG